MKEITRQDLVDIPKVELHLHLEGAIRLSTIIEISKELNLNREIYTRNPLNDHADENRKETDAYRQFYCITDKVDCLTSFLDKMWHTQALLHSTDVLERITFEVCEDAHLNNVKLLEIRYSPIFIMNSNKLDHSHLTCESIYEAIIAGIQRAQELYEVEVGLIGILDKSLGAYTLPIIASINS